MNHTYLILPRLHVCNANAQPAAWMIGPPPVTAYAGFAHALARACGAGHHQGVGIVHHDIQFLGEVEKGTLYPHQFRAASFIDKDDYASSNKHALSLQPSARCHLTVSLAIRFDAELPVDLQRVAAFLRGARLAGGAIVSHLFSETKDDCLLEDERDVARITKAIGAGFGLHERTDLMSLQADDEDLLDTFLRVTDRSHTRDKEDSWILPTALGYAQITPARPRANVRGGLPHAFAEPLIGLIQYRQLRTHDLPFWRYTCPRPGVFVVSTR